MKRNNYIALKDNKNITVFVPLERATIVLDKSNDKLTLTVFVPSRHSASHLATYEENEISPYDVERIKDTLR
jgi:hypothetical protein